MNLSAASASAAGSAPPRRALVMACLVVAMSMVALEATIVATATPEIVGRLHGAALYGWVFSAFLLAQAITTPLWGRCADIFGRRAILTAGLSLFLLGSWLCGAATGMPMLVAARVVQGLGAGAVQPICSTLVGDLYEGGARTRAQAWLSGVWGPSAVFAPVIGAALIATVGWRWVFWINLVPGALALIGVRGWLREPPRSRRAGEPVDFAGAIAFALFATATLLALARVAGGATGDARPTVGLVAIAAVGALAFFRIERRAVAPAISLGLWSRPVIASANVVTLAGCVALTGVTLLLPLYVQQVLRGSALSAGLTLTAMGVAWPLASMSTRWLHARIGARATLALGGACLTAGSASFLALGRSAPTGSIVAVIGSFVVGAGMGLLTLTSMVRIQADAAAVDRGAATSSNIFARALGGALGAALLGAMVAGRAGPPQALHRGFAVVVGIAAATLVLTLVAPIVPRRGRRNADHPRVEGAQ